MTEDSGVPEGLGTNRFIDTVRRLVGAAALIVILTYLYQFFGRGFSENTEQWGQFGDYVGGVLNPIIALAALSAILYAIRIQRTELDKAIKAFNDQARLAKEQKFDSKFFNMVSLYDGGMKGVSREFDGQEYSGYAAVKQCLYEFLYKVSEFAEYYRTKKEVGFAGDFYPLLGGYSNYYLGNSTMLMVIMKIIDISDIIEKSDIDFEDKQNYHKLFSSYISDETKAWMYIFFIFTKREGKVPPVYGCQGTFLQYMSEKAPPSVKIPSETLAYICGEIVSIVQKSNANQD